MNTESMRATPAEVTDQRLKDIMWKKSVMLCSHLAATKLQVTTFIFSGRILQYVMKLPYNIFTITYFLELL